MLNGISMKKIFEKFSLKSKLLFFALSIVIFVAGLLSLTFLYFAKQAIVTDLQSQMQSIRENKRKQILTYFSNKQADVFSLSSSSDVRTAFIDFRASFRNLNRIDGNKSVTAYLQQKYIYENTFSAEKRSEFFTANDNTDYGRLHTKYHRYFKKYIHDKSFYDLFVIDIDGNIVYTVTKELDFATNLEVGQYKDSNLGKVFRKARDSRDTTAVSYVDFEKYAPSNNEPAAFVASPILINGKVEGVLALQMPTDQINSAMYDDYLGNYGSVYLVGSDFLFRSNDQRMPNENFILKERNDTPAVRESLDRKSGVREEINYRGDSVFVAFTYIELLGSTYALIAEMKTEYALKPLEDLIQNVIVTFLIMVMVISFVTYFVAKNISAPILRAISILSSSTRQIVTTIEEQEKTAQMQSASVNQTSTTMAELGSSAKHTAEQSDLVALKSREAQETAIEGSRKVEEMVHSMEELRSKVDIISEQILELSEKNNQIGNIIGLVSDLANQTNMLALNAAVEAARAGEYGKGFAVVAGEIRKLADESKRSADKIQEILFEIKKATDSTVMATEEGNKKVQNSVSLGNQVVKAFDGLFVVINSVFTSTEQITLNVKQQSIAINEVVQAVNSLNRGSQETAIGISQTKEGIRQVKDATISMQKLVDGRQDLYKR
jgi:methyl-accepting chemotaxis protein